MNGELELSRGEVSVLLDALEDYTRELKATRWKIVRLARLQTPEQLELSDALKGIEQRRCLVQVVGSKLELAMQRG